jgi:predicted ATPase/DNA-binding CsgD family transcriptional regulator
VLRLTGEQMYEVPPLPLPENEPGKPIEDAEAVRLFVVRAQAARPSFELTDENARAIADICREVDGLPLAIELAAARIRHLSPVDLLARLSRRLALLNDGPLDAPARLRTMRDAIAWSHDLLSPDEQIVFRRMAVFAGGFTLGAAESVLRALASDGDTQAFLTTPAVFNALASLVDKSLLRPEMAPDGETRFTMLETIREFALEELAASGEETAARTALVGFVLELARQSRAALYLPQGGQLTEHLTNDRDNIRAAIRWLFEQEDRASSLQLLGVPTSIWRSIGNLSEARPWLEWIIAGGDELNGVDRATALVELGILRHLQGDEADALRLTEEGIALLKEHGAEQRLFPALSYLGLIVLRLGDFERASALQQESLRILETTVDEPWAPFAVSTVLGHLGNIAVAEGRIDRARDYFTAAIDRQRELGFQPGESHIFASHPIAGMGDVERAEGHLEQALEQYQLSLRQARRFTDRRAICYALGGVAGTLAAMGNWETAARLFGATEALHEVSGIPFDLETMDRQRALGLPEPWYRGDESFGVAQQFHDLLGAPNTRLASVPDPARATRLWQDGRHLSLTQAVDEALDAAIVPPGADAPVDAHGLTVREVEVLRLITEGHSDPDIAQALFISRRTAATHVANILRKLGVNSRAAAAAFAVRNGLA